VEGKTFEKQKEKFQTNPKKETKTKVLIEPNFFWQISFFQFIIVEKILV